MTFSEVFETEEEASLKAVDKLFKATLANKRKLMVTSYKRFSTNSNRLDNFVPLQTNNTYPIEVVIHLFNEEDNLDALNSSMSIVKQINDEQSDEQARNLTIIIKKTIEKANLTTNRRASLTTSPSPKTAKVSNTNVFDYEPEKKLRQKLKDAESQLKEISVEIVTIMSTNQFFLHMAEWEAEFEALCQSLEKDYDSNVTLDSFASNNSSTLPNLTLSITPVNGIAASLTSPITKLAEKSIHKGLVCVYANKETSVYRRVLIVDLPKKRAVQVYLLDLGKYETMCVDYLYSLLDKYIDLAPLCFECTLGLPKTTRIELDEQVSTQFKTLVHLNKNFKIRVLKELKPLEKVRLYILNIFEMKNKLLSKKDPNTYILSKEYPFFQKIEIEKKRGKTENLRIFENL